MTKIKILNKIEGTDLFRVEIDHVVCVKNKDSLDKLMREGRQDDKLYNKTN